VGLSLSPSPEEPKVRGWQIQEEGLAISTTTEEPKVWGWQIQEEILPFQVNPRRSTHWTYGAKRYLKSLWKFFWS
jgi:hypothetical protein